MDNMKFHANYDVVSGIFILRIEGADNALTMNLTADQYLQMATYFAKVGDSYIKALARGDIDGPSSR